MFVNIYSLRRTGRDTAKGLFIVVLGGKILKTKTEVKRLRPNV